MQGMTPHVYKKILCDMVMGNLPTPMVPYSCFLINYLQALKRLIGKLYELSLDRKCVRN